jgi:hypothetical protein
MVRCSGVGSNGGRPLIDGSDFSHAYNSPAKIRSSRETSIDRRRCGRRRSVGDFGTGARFTNPLLSEKWAS